ncbi:MAG: thermonuclease family protein [Spirochaetes bacterium]|nr:thermonuclease family protein [Spirochaetota bacterium]
MKYGKGSMNRLENFKFIIQWSIAVFFVFSIAYAVMSNKTFIEKYAYVVNVIDGDTFEVQFDDGHRDTVRLWGIDAPESYIKRHGYEEFLGKEAYLFIHSQLSAKRIKLKTLNKNGDFVRDKYQRILAFAYINNYDVAAILLEKGLAKVYRKGNSPHHQTYITLEKKARDQQLGIWNKSAEKNFYRKQFLSNQNRYLLIWFWENDKEFFRKIVCEKTHY